MPRGVTDGSNALPGQVGEFFQATAVIAYQAGATMTTSVGLGTLPPGDWDAWAFASLTSGVDLVLFALQPLPPGFTHPLGQAFIPGVTSTEDIVAVGPHGRANTTVPTAIVFTFEINAPVAGTATLWFNARRAR